MNVNGTLINYYIHCERQCWLLGNRINLEENSEEVRIGRILHSLKLEKQKHTEVSIDSIKIDKITDDYLLEIKKSDADVNAVYWQVMFYLKILKEKGVERKGKIEFIEKNKQDKKIIYVDYDKNENKLEEIISEVKELQSKKTPPEAVYEKKCKKCAYFEYCFI